MSNAVVRSTNLTPVVFRSHLLNTGRGYVHVFAWLVLDLPGEECWLLFEVDPQKTIWSTALKKISITITVKGSKLN